MLAETFSPRQLGEALGVSESSLKRWADEGKLRVSRTAGGHRRIALDEAARVIREYRLPVVRPHLLGLGDLESLSEPEAARLDPAEALFRALCDGDAYRVRGFLLSMYLSGESMARICDGPLAVSMHRIGELWKHGPEGIFIEHRATDLCIQSLSQIRTLMPAAPSDAPAAIGCAPSGDPYVLGSLAAAVVLASEGWREINLGPETPPAVLLEAARHSRARLAWISLTARPPLDGLDRAIPELSEDLAKIGTSLIIGGQALPDALTGAGSPVVAGSSMAELSAFARGLRARPGGTTRDGSKAGNGSTPPPGTEPGAGGAA